LSPGSRSAGVDRDGAQIIPQCASPVVALIVFVVVSGLILSRMNEEQGVRVAREPDAWASLVQ
jgi:hypothetical protein